MENLPTGFAPIKVILSPKKMPERVRTTIERKHPDAVVIEMTDSPEYVLNNHEWVQHRKALYKAVADLPISSHYYVLTGGYLGQPVSTCQLISFLQSAGIEYSLLQWNPMKHKYFIVPYVSGRASADDEALLDDFPDNWDMQEEAIA
jgi:hypothetical protein